MVLCFIVSSHSFILLLASLSFFFFFPFPPLCAMKKCSLGVSVSYQMLVCVKGDGDKDASQCYTQCVCVCVCVCVPAEHCVEAPVNIWPMCRWLVGEVPQDITLENVLACSRQQQCSFVQRVCVCVCVCVCVMASDYICDACRWGMIVLNVWENYYVRASFKMIVIFFFCVCVFVRERWLRGTCV